VGLCTIPYATLSLKSIIVSYIGSSSDSCFGVLGIDSEQCVGLHLTVIHHMKIPTIVPSTHVTMKVIPTAIATTGMLAAVGLSTLSSLSVATRNQMRFR